VRRFIPCVIIFNLHVENDLRALYGVLSSLNLPDPEKCYKIELKAGRLKHLIEKLIEVCQFLMCAHLLLKFSPQLRPPKEKYLRKQLDNFMAYVQNRYAKALETFSELEFRQMEENQELFEFLDDLIPLKEEDLDEEVISVEPRKRFVDHITT